MEVALKQMTDGFVFLITVFLLVDYALGPMLSQLELFLKIIRSVPTISRPLKSKGGQFH